jgi:hypothetical protein
MRKFRHRAGTVTESLCRIGSAFLIVAGAVTWSASTAASRPLVPAEERYIPYAGTVPSCSDPAVFERIQSRFAAREGEFWKTGLAITGFDHVREIGFRSNGLDYIPRRYCVARALMNDTKLRDVSYSIDEDLGIIGWWGSFDVEWCVSGLDRLRAFAPACKMARP